MTTEPPPISGVLCIDKPEGPTSMQVCARIRGKLKAGGAPKRIKVGHGGTLDPLATGVLVVLIGKATKLCDKVMVGAKGYEAAVDLSRRSATDDREGPIEAVEGSRDPGEAAVAEVCAGFVGTIQQRPPAFSAMHVDGKRAYQLARAGEEVKLEARPVRIDRCELMTYDWPVARLAIDCGKGTYIRSLARDLGAELASAHGSPMGGMLTELRRTHVGAFNLENAIRLDDLPETLDPWSLQSPAAFGLQ